MSVTAEIIQLITSAVQFMLLLCNQMLMQNSDMYGIGVKVFSISLCSELQKNTGILTENVKLFATDKSEKLKVKTQLLASASTDSSSV